MRASWAKTLAVLLLLLCTGCWDKYELTDFGYVQAVAIDFTTDGKLQLTTHFYNPAGGGGGGNQNGGSPKQGKKGINIVTSADTVSEAVRDIPIHLGRKAKWDHMRIILVGEDLARKQDLAEVLDFFSRDGEPRATNYVLVTQGKASDYLDVKSFIEYTIGQQLRKMEDYASTYSAKANDTTLLDLSIQMKGETGVTLLPYIDKNKSKDTIATNGTVLLKKGKVVGSVMTAKDTEGLIMLLDKYESGILEIACPNNSEANRKPKESVEVISLKTKVKPKIKDDDITVQVMTQIKGSIIEQRCMTLQTKEDEKKFVDKVKKIVESDIRKTIAFLQKEKIDGIGLGNYIYQRNPQLWKAWKPSWDDRFAEAKFEVNVEVMILNTGADVGKPLSKK